MFAQSQVGLHFMKTHAHNGDQWIFLTIDNLVLQRFFRCVKINGNRLGAKTLKLFHDDAAFHNANLLSLKIVRSEKRFVSRKMFKAVFPKGHSDKTDFMQIVKEHLTGFSIKHGVDVFARRKEKWKIGVLHRRNCDAHFCGWRQ